MGYKLVVQPNLRGGNLNLEILEASWSRNIDRWGGNSLQAERWFRFLVRQYTSKERQYHSLNHVIHLLLLAEKYKAAINNRQAFYIAIWFHDVIQNRFTANEKVSAQMCLEAIGDLELSSEANEAAELILATEDHMSTKSSDERLFVDLDLAILGSSREEYSQYAKQCRDEYNLPGGQYCRGRIRILKSFLQRDYLYQTSVFRKTFEYQARQNIAWEIDALTKEGAL